MSEDGNDGSSNGITRISKACDPCRTRKTRCDIATQMVCSECLKRDQAAQCTIREKARPNRPLPAKASSKDKSGVKRRRLSTSMDVLDGSGSVNVSDDPIRGVPGSETRRHVTFSPLGYAHNAGSSIMGEPPSQSSRPDSGPRVVERVLSEEALERYGLRLDLSLPPKNIFDTVKTTRHSLDEIGLIPGDPAAVRQAQHWINTHFQAIHHNTPFLSLPDVLDTANELLSKPIGLFGPTVQHDRLALLYAVLALGSLREQTYDPQAKKYRALKSGLDIDDSGVNASPLSSVSVPSYRSRSTALFLFRLSADELDSLEQPSEIAVQALFILHTFISNTSMGRRSRDYVARAIMMAHELGLNRRIPTDLDVSSRTKHDKMTMRRRAMLYLHVYFSDVYLSALDSHPPLIKRQDYDPEIFDVVCQTSNSGIDTPSGTPLNGIMAFVDLVTTIGSILERLHVPISSSNSRVEHVLRLENEIDNLRDRLGSFTFGANLNDSVSTDSIKRTACAGAILRQIHYNWSRIALRAPFLREPLLRHSSLSICARSAMSILTLHRHVISSAMLNLPWMQLSRITTSIYLVFIGHWHGEVIPSECQTAVNCTLDLLRVISTRWESASKVAQTVMQLADASGLEYQKPTEEAQAGSLSNDLAQLAAVATSSSMLDGTPMQQNALPDWAFDVAIAPNDPPDPLGQLFDMDTIRGFGADLAAMGVDMDLIGWQQSLQGPPW